MPNLAGRSSVCQPSGCFELSEKQQSFKQIKDPLRYDTIHNKTLYEHFSRWVIKAYSAINLIYGMFNSTRVHGWSIYGAVCHITFMLRPSVNCGEIKQVVREWAEFSYKAMFTCSYLSGRF